MKILKQLLYILPLIFFTCQQSVTFPDNALCIENITTIDPIEGLKSNQTVIIHDELIHKIAPTNQLRLAPSNRIIDGTGKFLIPGLWDAHVHFAYMEELAPSMFDLFLSYGITSVRDTGGEINFVLKWKEKAAKNPTGAPNVYIAGPLIDGEPNVYDGSTPSRPPLSVGIETVEGITWQIHKLDSLGVDFLKAYEMLTPEQFQKIMKLADSWDLKVTGHVPLSMDVIGASEAGLNSMEHLRNVDCLHEKGFTGKGITIAHFDDGFDGFDKMEAFKYARENGLVKGNYDFCFDTPIEYDGNGSHGTNTLSVVNGYLPGEYVGMAFDANILLAHTEYGPSETHKEEENWRRAVDWAYENKVDIITSSLQYNNFDEGQGNYDYKKDLDGNTTIIAKAADYAASKGILVVAIQGNFGNDDWYYVATPGDADSVLTVGAAGVDGKKASFSSFGPSADGQVKPDVMAVGFQTIIINPDGKIRPGNGTSFAGPGVAGMVACLMQAHPDRNQMEIINAVRQSADRYLAPDVKGGYGYGIPDACKAHDILTDMDANLTKKGKLQKAAYTMKKSKNSVCIKPKAGKKQVESVKLFDDTGLLVNTMSKPKKIKLKGMESGLYVIQMKLKSGETIVENFKK